MYEISEGEGSVGILAKHARKQRSGLSKVKFDNDSQPEKEARKQHLNPGKVVAHPHGLGVTCNTIVVKHRQIDRLPCIRSAGNSHDWISEYSALNFII